MPQISVAVTDSENHTPSFRSRWFARPNLTRAIKVAVVVGTALVTINHGDALIAGQMPPLWKVALTFLVPYLVSSYAGARASG